MNRLLLSIFFMLGVFGLKAQTGIIKTIAGGGVGDGIIATNASLYNPYSVAIDASGNIFITDNVHHRIRKVNSVTGMISTVAGNGFANYTGDGGLATSASLNSPSGVALDASGNIFIADYGNHRIRKVNISTGIITTVAGNGVATFAGDGGAAISSSLNEPIALTINASGNILIADASNNRIRKVDTSTGIITTIAGNGVAAYAGDGIIATTASLNSPASVTVDASGNVFIADLYNNRIRKVDALTGIITTVAGNGGTGAYAGDGAAATSALLYAPSGVLVDASGNIFIADASNHRFRKVTASTGVITTIAGNGTGAYAGDGSLAINASLYSPRGLAFDVFGNIFIADQFNHSIRKIDASTSIISRVAGTGSYTYGGDGGTATGATLRNPIAIDLDASGNIFIADHDNQRVRKINASTGIITTIAGNGTKAYSGDGGLAINASLNNPNGVAVDAFGNIYIADQFNYRIRKVSALTGIITTIAGNGINIDNGDGGLATTASIFAPYGIAIDTFNNIFIVNSGLVRKVNAVTNIISTVAGGGASGDGVAATTASLNHATGVAVDASGNIYIVDQFNQRIRKVTATTGIITRVAGIAGTTSGAYNGDGILATNASLNNPYGVTVDSYGNIYIADQFNHRIRKITASTGIITTIAGNGVGGISGDGSIATNASVYYPAGVAVDTFGNIYIADASNQRIRKITINSTTPLNLVSFSVQSTNKNAFLNWQTTNEINLRHFVIERSSNGSSFTAIGSTNAKGSNNYSFTDNTLPVATVLYYRLQIIDKDGKTGYSPTVLVILKNKTSISIAPNPTTGLATLQLQTSVAAENIQITVYDLAGKQVLQQSRQIVLGNNSIPVNIGALQSGVYYLQVSSNTRNEILKLIKE